jgi:hypothetical protein
MINFQTTRAETALIEQISKRAMECLAETLPELDYTRTDCAMDITATHLNGCPLRLDALLVARDFDFLHDILGIRRHLNRETGQLSHFLPRYAKMEGAA